MRWGGKWCWGFGGWEGSCAGHGIGEESDWGWGGHWEKGGGHWAGLVVGEGWEGNGCWGKIVCWEADRVLGR